MEADDQDQRGEKDIESPDVVDKYKAASEIANNAMLQLLQNIKPGQNIVEVCQIGDKLIQDGANGTYKKLKEGEKGIAFPTCVSVNNCVGHFSPLPDDPAVVLKVGDVVKIDLGAHIDGYVSTCAHTLILGQDPEAGAQSGRAADVVCAAYFASECAIRLARPGKKNTDVTAAIRKVAEIFKVNPVEAVLSHRMKQDVIDGNQVVANRIEPDQQVEEFVFATNQVYAFDIVMSTGDGKAREETSRTTVYKRALDRSYQLKLQASRQLFSEIQKRFPVHPFSLRSLDEKKRRLGIVELVKHDLLQAYPVLYEKDGEIVAQFKFTALILPNSTMRMNAFPLPFVTSQYAVESDPEIKAIMAMSTKRTNKKKKGKKPGGAAGGAGGKDDDDGEEDKMDTTA
jgi:curved DNA binding protein